MDRFVVSARKYRPAVFDHVAGQPHITTTLKNAIKYNHLAQVFLFCGPRGVGKTTCARILAKTINCQAITDDTEPCNACTSCVNFHNNRSLNIYELDAASHNSVEDIRALVTQVRYPPQTGKYKVYIIDEVHMLSNSAFNAFLKTLEEPPAYAIFILATTEKHKIIPTILSRCQIFDFHRIQPQDMVQCLQRIVTEENITCEEAALYLISHQVDGALRDALSIFDLMVAFSSGKPITLQMARAHLHVLDNAYYFRITDAFLAHDPGAALLVYDEILQKGFDGRHFITGLGEHFRNLIMSRHHQASLQLLTVPDSVKAQYQIQATQTTGDFLLKSINIINQCNIHYQASHHKRLHVELALITLASLQVTTPTAQTSHKEASIPKAAQPKDPSTLGTRQVAPSLTTSTVQPMHRTQGSPVSPPPSLADQPTNSTRETAAIPQIDQLKKHIDQQVQSVTSTPQPPIEQPRIIKEATVQQHWQTYVQRLKQAGKMTEYSLLNQAVKLVGTTILLTLYSEAQRDILADIQKDLIAYLRQSLACKPLIIKATLASSPQHKKPYTAREKFTYLMAKYPTLSKLQEKLLLEVQD